MAPPPTTPGQSLQERLLSVAQTLQFAWFVGHVTLLMSTARYSLSYITFKYYSKWVLLGEEPDEGHGWNIQSALPPVLLNL